MRTLRAVAETGHMERGQWELDSPRPSEKPGEGDLFFTQEGPEQFSRTTRKHQGHNSLLMN